MNLEWSNWPAQVHGEFIFPDAAKLDKDGVRIVRRNELKILARSHSHSAVKIKDECAKLC